MMRRCGLTMTAKPAAATKDSARYRTVVVCPRWRHYPDFLDDMGQCPEGYTLDRFPDRAGNYEPGNCRWATIIQQNSNRDFCREIEFLGRKQTLSAWARELGINFATLWDRLDAGWSIQRAFSLPRKPAATATSPSGRSLRSTRSA
jgi:hypothetical protein